MSDAKRGGGGRKSKDGLEIVYRKTVTLSLDALTDEVLYSFSDSCSESIRALAHAYVKLRDGAPKVAAAAVVPELKPRTQRAQAVPIIPRR